MCIVKKDDIFYVTNTNGTKIKVLCEYKLLFKGYIMTLFGRIATRRTRLVMEKYFKTKSGKETINHESIHIDQEQRLPLGWVTYYIVYFWYYIIMLLRYFNHDMAYKTIPFEIEAYENDSNYDYLDNPTDWKRYRMNLKDRKDYYIDRYGK